MRIRSVFVVARGQVELWRQLARAFADDEEVRVVQDRRRGERRQGVEPRGLDRRVQDRGRLDARGDASPRPFQRSGPFGVGST
ncbi:MAG: hypothetical protein HYY64_07455 [Candidatus Rokubacteria bacterium]|nr:hypothetical protein [Candidatus Rokubacteria bacterium]